MITTLLVAALILALFTGLSLLAQRWQQHRDDVNAFAALADKANRPSTMPQPRGLLAQIPTQLHHRPGGRHAR